MEFLHHTLHLLNEFSGAFLLLIAIGTLARSSSQRDMQEDLRCLHVDFYRYATGLDMRCPENEKRARRP